MLKIGAICCACGALAGSTLLGGCASEVPRRAGWGLPEEHAQVGSQGGSWEVVFATPETQRGLAELGLESPEARWEYSRRNLALNPRADGPVLATGEWPEPARNSLTRPRRVNLPDRADDYLFFVPRGTTYQGRSWRWYGH